MERAIIELQYKSDTWTNSAEKNERENVVHSDTEKSFPGEKKWTILWCVCIVRNVGVMPECMHTKKTELFKSEII